jgi:hypothetical protein
VIRGSISYEIMRFKMPILFSVVVKWDYVADVP